MDNLKFIPSVHFYQPRIDEEYHLQHHRTESISSQSRTRSPSLISAVSAETDDGAGLLNEHARHTRLTHYDPESSQEEDQVQNRNQALSLQSNDHSHNNEINATSQTPSEPLIPQPVLLPELPAPAAALASNRSRREPIRYFSHVGWSPHVGHEQEIQGGHKLGHKMGLKMRNLWSNAKKWRICNWLRVLRYRGGLSLFTIAVLPLVTFIASVIYCSVKKSP